MSSFQRNSSDITSTLIPDEPLQQVAGFRFNADDRQYIDNQITGTQAHVSDLLINGILGTYFFLSSGSDAVVEGDVVCLSVGEPTDSIPVVTKAYGAALADAGAAVGVVVLAASPGTRVKVATAGALVPAIAGMRDAAVSVGTAIVKTTTARCEFTAEALGDSDYPVGTVTQGGGLYISPTMQPSVFGAGGGGGGGSTIPDGSAIGQVLRLTAVPDTWAWGAVNMADTDAVTGILAVANGGTGLDASTATAVGAVLRITSSGVAAWGAVNMADTDAVTGILAVANGGTGLNASTATTVGNQLSVASSGVLSYAALNLAGGSGYVSGLLPTANQAAQAMGGDSSGTTAACVNAQLSSSGVARIAINGTTNIKVGSGTGNPSLPILFYHASETFTPGQTSGTMGFLNFPCVTARFLTWTLSNGIAYSLISQNGDTLFLGDDTFAQSVQLVGGNITLSNNVATRKLVGATSHTQDNSAYHIFASTSAVEAFRITSASAGANLLEWVSTCTSVKFNYADAAKFLEFQSNGATSLYVGASVICSVTTEWGATATTRTKSSQHAATVNNTTTSVPSVTQADDSTVTYTANVVATRISDGASYAQTHTVTYSRTGGASVAIVGAIESSTSQRNAAGVTAGLASTIDSSGTSVRVRCTSTTAADYLFNVDFTQQKTAAP